MAVVVLFVVTGCDPDAPPTATGSARPGASTPAGTAAQPGATGSAGAGAARPSVSVSAGPPKASVPPFSVAVPAVPRVASATVTGAVRQQQRVAGRDNGQSTLYGDRSVWVFDDTTFKDPWGFLSNSGAATRDLDAADGIDLTSNNPVTVDAARTPVELIPRTTAEKDYEKAHGVLFGFWPGPVVADPARDRVLVFYGKLCRGGPAGSTCTGPLGKGLGTGIAAIDMRTGAVTRLPAVTSVEGVDRTMFFPDGQGWSSSALTADGEGGRAEPGAVREEHGPWRSRCRSTPRWSGERGGVDTVIGRRKRSPERPSPERQEVPVGHGVLHGCARRHDAGTVPSRQHPPFARG